MCGIVGIHSLAGAAKKYEAHLEKALQRLSKRGPDHRGMFFHNRVALGHTRLSIIDTSEAGSQPMMDSSGRYVIIYNGEIYNFRELKKTLDGKGINCQSHTDTEVLLYLYILHKEKCLDLINGFFAFAIYDTYEQSLFLARDRIGIKPLLFYQDDDKILFSSEMKALLSFPVNKDIDHTSLYLYLQLNYIPAPSSIFSHVKKIEPGHYMTISADGTVQIRQYYRISYDPVSRNGNAKNYEEAKTNLRNLLSESVKKRLVADVPLGAFLSGGIDSSIIVALASQFAQLNTFSIGFKDEPLFDETHFANLVAKKFNTHHHAFALSTDDLYNNLLDILDYLDEPFADSSAIPVYILSKYTRTKVTVALSGDGADELFAGYNKHLAEFRVKHNRLLNLITKMSKPVFSHLPQSRNTRAGNFARQLNRYAEGLELDADDRYWRWCTYINEREAARILKVHDEPLENTSEYVSRKKALLTYHKKEGTINDVLYTDMHLILPNDMLMKVDSMSMANSLEVRVPFLDHQVVDYVFTLPADFKISKGFRKRILKDAFKDVLPAELYHRGKQGFEVPLLKWFKNGLRKMIDEELLGKERIQNQGLFSTACVEGVKKKLFSNSPGESVAQIWGLLVFQYWHRKYLE
ncbi:MAG TPA: asparagine synthase (glutamine-hydrolyzing) [Chitinophagales bacterium]|nr:asparagine synthase (glutamine-hydrolyzing) [Chitinophagales bacterium]